MVSRHKPEYKATQVARGWAGAIFEVIRAFWKQQYGQRINKAGYTATLVACGWRGAIFEVTRPFGQEQ